MGMNKLLGLVPVFFSVAAMAQQDTAGVASPSLHRFTIEAVGGYDSNVLCNDLVTALYRGGDVGRDIRNRSLEHLGGMNRGGFLLGGRMTYAWGDSLFGVANWMPRISVAYNSILGMRFAKDAYTVAFFGNAGFEGGTAQLAPASLHWSNYQTLSVGIEDRRTGTYVELSVVNGQDLNAAQITRADLYTADDGRYLDLKLKGDLHQSDTTGNELSSGLGAAITMAWHKKLHLLGTDAELSIGVTDLGFIAWNNRSLSIKKDSTVHYEGVEVNDILDLDNLVVNTTSLQDTLGLGYTKGGFSTLLPAKLEGRLSFGTLGKPSPVRGLRAYELALEQRYLPGYLPYVTATRNLVATTWCAASVGAAFGGFGGLRATVGIDAVIKKQLRIGVFTPNAVGLCSSHAQGKAVSVRAELAW
jgi:hypothetical protein